MEVKTEDWSYEIESWGLSGYTRSRGDMVCWDYWVNNQVIIEITVVLHALWKLESKVRWVYLYHV